ncbi:unnamed protein product, partial [marine sediment metagenome]
MIDTNKVRIVFMTLPFGNKIIELCDAYDSIIWQHKRLREALDNSRVAMDDVYCGMYNPNEENDV